MKLTDKRFWIWEFSITFFLTALPLMFYGENITVIMLIVVSYVGEARKTKNGMQY